MKDCQNMGCLARGTDWCDGVGTPPMAVICYGYMPLVMDDLIPDESVPDSAWTDKIPDGVMRGSFGSFKNPVSK